VLVVTGALALAAGIYFGRESGEPLTADLRGKDAAALRDLAAGHEGP
jgi:hypothetical protein